MIEELMARAGASDNDREAWLAERRQGVTATEVRELAKGGAGVRDQIAQEKRDGTTAFAGNRYTEWGKQREPALNAVLAAAGIEPESRVFHGENPRYLASPDGIGVNPIDGEIIIGEIKTSSHEVMPGSDKFAEYGYYDQMQWQMLVCGAARCLYVLEQHDGNWPNPEPLPHRVAWVDRDDERIGQLIEVADEFLAFLDGERDLTARELAKIRVQAEGMAWHKAKAAEHEKKLRELIAGRAIKHELDGKRFGTVSVSYSGDKTVQEPTVDMDTARDEVPELFAAVEAAQLALDEALEKYTSMRSVAKRGRLTVKGVAE